jgi:hypothetical protein
VFRFFCEEAAMMMMMMMMLGDRFEEEEVSGVAGRNRNRRSLVVLHTWIIMRDTHTKMGMADLFVKSFSEGWR